jgi:uncharacterized protein (DUF2252 family)
MAGDEVTTDNGPRVEGVSDAVAEGVATARARAGERGKQASRQPKVAHPSVAERESKGRVARATTPPEWLAGWTPPADRADPVGLLLGQETSRVQDLLPVRHARMAVSAFTFYRGSALVMASDLSGGPRSGLDVQLCGDAHLSNFGLFAAPDRSVVFDVNDFDETLPGPFEWDVKRLAASFVLAARDNGLSGKVARRCAETAAASYRASIQKLAGQAELTIWYTTTDTQVTSSLRELQASPTLSKSQQAKVAKKAKEAKKATDKAVAKARSRDAWSAIAKLTEVVDGQRRFLNSPPLLTRIDLNDEARSILHTLFREYRATLQDDRQHLLKRYEIIDFGHKVVGVGSVGLLAFVLLMRGRDENDLMVLQVKQAQASVLEAYTKKSAFSKHGHRVVNGQRLMQAASDSFLGWIDGPGGRSFYVRQLRDMKWSPDPASLNAERLPRYAALCGVTLARAHARTGDAIAIGAYLGQDDTFEKAIASFATTYADQVAVDFDAFTAAIAHGDVTAHESTAGDETAAAATTLAGPSAESPTS